MATSPDSMSAVSGFCFSWLKEQTTCSLHRGVPPPADILNKLADVLGTSVDYLINATTGEKAKASLKNTELLQRFKEVETLPEREQSVLLEIIGAYIRDFRTSQVHAAQHINNQETIVIGDKIWVDNL